MLASLDVYEIISYVEQHFSVSVCLYASTRETFWQILTKFSTKRDLTQNLYLSVSNPGQ